MLLLVVFSNTLVGLRYRLELEKPNPSRLVVFVFQYLTIIDLIIFTEIF